jgi:hypothetical protein
MPKADLVKRLRAVDGMCVEDCFMQSPLFAEAADEIERLRAEIFVYRGRLKMIERLAMNFVGSLEQPSLNETEKGGGDV